MTPGALGRLVRIVAVGVLCSTVSVPRSSAEPLVVTSGFLYIPWDDPTSLEFFGADGSALQALFIGVTSSPQRTCFVGCAPGTAVDLGAEAGGPSPFTPFTLGTLTAANVDGFQWSSGFSQDSPRLAGSLHFEAPTIVLPPFDQIDNPFSAVFTAPFTFTGEVAGFAPDDLSLSTPLFRLTLTGRGTTTAIFDLFGGVYGAPEITYTFAAASSPDVVPEPATIVLVGTVLAGIGIRRHRRKRM